MLDRGVRACRSSRSAKARRPRASSSSTTRRTRCSPALPRADGVAEFPVPIGVLYRSAARPTTRTFNAQVALATREGRRRRSQEGDLRWQHLDRRRRRSVPRPLAELADLPRARGVLVRHRRHRHVGRQARARGVRRDASAPATRGSRVVPVTGRPAGWVDHIARMWPVDGVVGENGGLWFWMAGRKAPAAVRAERRGAAREPETVGCDGGGDPRGGAGDGARERPAVPRARSGDRLLRGRAATRHGRRRSHRARVHGRRCRRARCRAST